MTNLINIKIGSFRTINYTGEIKHFGDVLAEAAKEDPLLEQQVLFAANEIKYLQLSREKGEEMIKQLLNPQSH
jgi:hypothetical protein